jgi:hypothetical protein
MSNNQNTVFAAAFAAVGVRNADEVLKKLEAQLRPMTCECCGYKGTEKDVFVVGSLVGPFSESKCKKCLAAGVLSENEAVMFAVNNPVWLDEEGDWYDLIVATAVYHGHDLNMYWTKGYEIRMEMERENKRMREEAASKIRHEKRMAKDAAKQEERKALKEAKRLSHERQIKRLATYYKAVEMCIKKVKTEVGDFAEVTEAKRGTTLAAQRHNSRLIAHNWEVRKACLAEQVPGLAEATTIVSIPFYYADGTRVEQEIWNQAFWAAIDKYGVPHWTQSSIKAGTFYFVREAMFNKLAAVWNLDEDLKTYANYFGLVFSEMDGETMKFMVDMVEPASDGQDGNCAVPLDMVPMSSQVRVMKLHRTKKVPVSVGKGIIVPMKDARLPHLNDSQVKFGKGEKGEFVMMTSASTTSQPVQMYTSAEPLMLLNDNDETRTFFSDRVREEVYELVSLLTEDKIPELLRRLGMLRVNLDGSIDSPKMAVGSALMANMPLGDEIWSRITRFMVDDIVNRIVPSGAVKGWASLMVISDEHGAKECKRENARFFMIRIPTTKIVWLDKDPYVKGKGYVVHSSVATKMSGDADGDRVLLIKEREVVEMFKKHLNTKIDSGLKPSKNRDPRSLNPMALADLAIDLVKARGLVGTLTVASWKFGQVGMFELMAEALEMGNDEPMTYKHDIWLVRKDGSKVRFHDEVYAFLKKWGKFLNGVRQDDGTIVGGIHLQWRDAQKASSEWKSVRDMKDHTIKDEKSMFDAMWNAGVDAVQYWSKENPQKPVSLTSVARKVFASNGTTIPGAAWREARDMIETWGSYWGEHHDDDGNLIGEDHGAIYEQAREWAMKADTLALAAILLWSPKNGNTGFSLKWHTVFSSGRAHEVLGYRPSVKEAIEALKKDMVVDSEAIVCVNDLVEALFSTNDITVE